MALKEFKTIIALRRDIVDNYDPSEVLKKGEAAFVELGSGEVKVKVGDGVTTFADLNYIDKPIEDELKSSILKGYFRYNNFYVDEEGTDIYEPKTYKIYIDIPSSKAYIYDGKNYKRLFPEVFASEEAAGIAKLYDSFGNHSDGSISQYRITEELGKKISVEIGEDNETLVFLPPTN